VAVHGSFERLEAAFDLFDGRGRADWDVDRLTDFRPLGRDIVLTMCPYCARGLRFVDAATSTYEDISRWYAH